MRKIKTQIEKYPSVFGCDYFNGYIYYGQK